MYNKKKSRNITLFGTLSQSQAADNTFDNILEILYGANQAAADPAVFIDYKYRWSTYDVKHLPRIGLAVQEHGE